MVWFCVFLWCLVGAFGDTYGLKSVSVKEGESVTLHTDREMRNNDVIQWRFGPENILIAEINVVDSSMTVNYDYDGRFRDRMKVDRQTGCLTITDTRIEHAGRYELKIKLMKKFFILTVYGAVDDGDEMKSVPVMEGNSVTLQTDTEMNNDLIQWRFGNYLIAEIVDTANGITIYDDVLEGRFRDGLQVDEKTGSLSFKNARLEHSGFYQLQSNRTRKVFTLSVYAPLPVPVIFSYCPPSSSSSASKCMLLCSAVNGGQGTLSWYKENHLLSSISVSDLSSLSLPLEMEYQDQNTYRCVLNNSFSEQTQHLDISEHCHTCSDSGHGCETVQAVIRLVVTALMGVAAAAAVVVLYYDIRSRRAEQNRAHPSISAI
ncbi:tyrosine-protein kinase-like otk [Carassius auratus]|uniref:Tyrosine-protein kinase-like otk n=1 Tax=Carassius auratus TaxID=7957 RepID=A0A6P6K096_CARAU|nr:tyrosine-protein kinase-like otk [Carassius auratus]